MGSCEVQTSVVPMEGSRPLTPERNPRRLAGDKEYIFRKKSEDTFFFLQGQSNKEQTGPEAERWSLYFDTRPMPFLSPSFMT